MNTSLEVGGTAQTPASGRAACAVPASAERQGVEGTTEEMGHGQHVFAAIKLKTHDPSTLLGCIPASQCTWYAPQS